MICRPPDVIGLLGCPCSSKESATANLPTNHEQLTPHLDSAVWAVYLRFDDNPQATLVTLTPIAFNTYTTF